MPGFILETTQQADLQPLIANGVPVFLTLRQIRTELRNALTGEHAALFAEPNADPDSGDIQWYAPVGGSKVRLSELSGPGLAVAREKIAQLITDISNRAETLKNSTNQTSRLMANNLALAIEIPDESHIFMVGDQPVLAGWGHVPRGPAAPQQLLQKLAGQILSHRTHIPALPTPAEKPEPPITTSTHAQEPGRYRLEVSRTTLASVPAIVGGLSWLSALLWLLFVLLLLAIGYLLLKNCALGWPGADGLRLAIFNYCDAPALVTNIPPPDDSAQRRLLDQLAVLDTQLRDKRNQCVAREPEPPPRTETQELIEQRGGKIGAVNVILRWEHADDLDLHVRCPDGSEISFSNKTACGATLDVDANAGSTIANPAENITWPKDAIRPGEYIVEVDRYAKRTDSNLANFTVELLIDGERVDFHPQSIESGKKHVFTFTLPYVGHPQR